MHHKFMNTTIYLIKKFTNSKQDMGYRCILSYIITTSYLSYMRHGQLLKSTLNLGPHSGVLTQHQLEGERYIQFVYSLTTVLN